MVMTMKRVMKWGAWMLMGGLLTLALPGCGDDPSYEDVVPDAPTVTITTHGVSGVVTAMSGDPISGATVTAAAAGQSFSATTGADGTYVIHDVTVTGTITVTAAAEGKQESAVDVSIPSDGKAHQAAANFMLANAAKSVKLTGEDQVIIVEVETSKVVMEDSTLFVMNVPAAAAEGEFELAPIYPGDANAALRAQEPTTLVGLSVTGKGEHSKIGKAFPTSCNVGKEIANQCKVMANKGNGLQEIPFAVEEDHVVFDVDEFGLYYVIGDVEVSVSSSSIPIAVSGNFDNLHGASDLTVGSIAYTYWVGGELDAPKGKAAAMLHGVLQGRVNSSTVQERTGSYPLDLVLPVGTAASVSGTQTVAVITVSGFGLSLSAKVYGGVSITVSTYNRNHSGGIVTD